MIKSNKLNKGQEYWNKAKKIIPGGTLLFSKNPDLYLPKRWPAYFSKAKKCHIWDLDNKKYLDFATMGVGTNILGYANKIINRKVIQTINKSNIATLNSIEEIELSKLLLKIEPWAKMVRYTKTGGEANLVALRAARFYTKKSKIAFCGYHGWHDWYLSSILTKKSSLDQHLMRGLRKDGIPKNLKDTSFSFDFNNIEQFKKIIKKKDIGAVIMEVSRLKKTSRKFLLEIRKLTKKNNICLIFDECTSGFRECYGGLHKKYNINPDIIVLGKSIANGYPLCAIVGVKKYMTQLEKSFVSSTFWTDRIGFVAAIETLKEMKKQKSWLKITATGKKIKKIWKNKAEKYKLDITINGLDALPVLKFNNLEEYEIKTYLTQEFLKKKFLTSTYIYPCIYHDKTILNKYSIILEKIFKKISICIKNNYKISKLLDGPICKIGLRNPDEF